MEGPSKVTIRSWNTQQNRDARERLEEPGRTHGVRVALLKEAEPPQPTQEWTTLPSVTDADLWAVEAHSDRADPAGCFGGRRGQVLR